MLQKLLLISSIALMSTHVLAYDAQVCKKQKYDLEEQLKNAKKSNNTLYIRRLEKSLERVNKVCDRSLKK